MPQDKPSKKSFKSIILCLNLIIVDDRGNQSAITASLEPVYLTSALLFLSDVETVTGFPFISKNCHEAMLTIKVNPAAFSESPDDILRFFPNINTIIVKKISCFKRSDTLQDTVTSLIVKEVNFCNITREQLRFADRVIEAWMYVPPQIRLPDISIFPRLERLTICGCTSKCIRPTGRLKRLTARGLFLQRNLFTVFPPDCTEQIIVVTKDPVHFSSKTLHPPPNARFFCGGIRECVAPEDFPFLSGFIRPSDPFGINELRAFNKALPIPHSNVSIWFLTWCVRSGLSLTGITSLTISFLNCCTITIPTSVVKRELEQFTENVSVLGTDNITSLIVKNDGVVTTPCPKLQALKWWGKTLSCKNIPFPARKVRSLSELVVDVGVFGPDFRFPQG